MRGFFIAGAVVAVFFLASVERPEKKEDGKPNSRTVEVILSDIGSPVGAATEKSKLTVYSEPSWCIPCKRFERDGVPEAMRKSGWIVDIQGGDGGPVPRFTLSFNGKSHSSVGYAGKAKFYEWVRNVTSR